MKERSLEEFFAGEYELADSFTPTAQLLREDPWTKLRNALIPDDSIHSMESGEELPVDFQNVITRTQSQILAMWRPEFETPYLERTKRPPSPDTPALFDCSLEDEEFLAIPSQLCLSPDFKTAGGKTIPPPSPANRQKAQNIINEGLSVGEVPVSFVGFSTASRKKIKSPSKSAMERADMLLRSVPEEFDASGCDWRDNENADLNQCQEEIQELSNISANPPMAVGFATASGKKIKSPSKRAFEKAQALMISVDDSVQPKSLANSSKKIDGKSDEAFEATDGGTRKAIGFTTASGRKVASPSKSAREKADEIFRSVAEDTPPKNFTTPTFSSASGKSIGPPSSMAVARAAADETIPLRKPKPNNRPFKPPTPINPFKSLPTPPFRNGRPSLNKTGFLNKLSETVPHANEVAASSIPAAERRLFDLGAAPGARNSLGNLLIPSRRPAINRIMAIGDVKSIFSFMPDRWISNHLNLIGWKLAAYEATGISDICDMQVDLQTVFKQLCYRFEREVNLAQRSILKKISERDDSPAGYMVLFVYSIEFTGGAIQISVSDGWYVLDVTHDLKIERLVRCNHIRVGQKLKIALGQLVSEEACDILDAKERGVKLKIFGNSTRPAKWHAKLGKQRIPMFVVSLASIDADGGPVACIQVVVIRRYPIVYTVEWDSGRRQTVSQEQLDDLTKPQYNDDDRGREKIAAVRMSVKFRAMDYSGCPRSAAAIITLWDSSPEMYARITDGVVLRVS